MTWKNTREAVCIESTHTRRAANRGQPARERGTDDDSSCPQRLGEQVRIHCRAQGRTTLDPRCVRGWSPPMTMKVGVA